MEAVRSTPTALLHRDLALLAARQCPARRRRGARPGGAGHAAPPDRRRWSATGAWRSARTGPGSRPRWRPTGPGGPGPCSTAGGGAAGQPAARHALGGRRAGDPQLPAQPGAAPGRARAAAGAVVLLRGHPGRPARPGAAPGPGLSGGPAGRPAAGPRRRRRPRPDRGPGRRSPRCWAGPGRPCWWPATTAAPPARWPAG